MLARRHGVTCQSPLGDMGESGDSSQAARTRQLRQCVKTTISLARSAKSDGPKLEPSKEAAIGRTPFAPRRQSGWHDLGKRARQGAGPVVSPRFVRAWLRQAAGAHADPNGK